MADVDTVRTTSTRRITGAGLKKCRPTTSRGRDVAAGLGALYVHPLLDQFDMFAWQRIDEISTVGYTEGRDALAAWVRTLGTRTT